MDGRVAVRVSQFGDFEFLFSVALVSVSETKVLLGV